MTIYAQPAAAAATAFLTANGGLFSRSLTSATVFSTAFGLEKQITELSDTAAIAGLDFVRNAGLAFAREDYKANAYSCIKTVSSIALNALAFYTIAFAASTVLSFVAIPVAALTVKNAILSSLASAVFAKAMDFALSGSNQEDEPLYDFATNTARSIGDLPEVAVRR